MIELNKRYIFNYIHDTSPDNEYKIYSGMECTVNRIESYGKFRISVILDNGHTFLCKEDELTPIYDLPEDLFKI